MGGGRNGRKEEGKEEGRVCENGRVKEERDDNEKVRSGVAKKQQHCFSTMPQETPPLGPTNLLYASCRMVTISLWPPPSARSMAPWSPHRPRW